jgi:hypothetical protein
VTIEDALRAENELLKQQRDVARGMAETFRRRFLAVQERLQSLVLDLEAAQNALAARDTLTRRQRCHTVRLPIEQRRDGEDYELTTTDEAPGHGRRRRNRLHARAGDRPARRRCEMTEGEFEMRAVKAYRRELGIPAGWWGTRTDMTDGARRVRRQGPHGSWTVSLYGKQISRHSERSTAIRKARSL